LTKVEVDPTGLDIETAHAYDAQGNRTSTTVYNPATSSNNAVYAFTYDKANRLEKLTNPNTSNYQLWTYNDHGEVATHRDANSKVVTFSYDNLGRVISEAHGSPFSVTITRTYYASTSLPIEVDDGTREIVNTYNVRLELTATDWSVSSSAFKSLDFTYDSAGNRDEIVDPEGAISGYSYTYKNVYDDDNRLWKVKRGGTDEGVYLYDASGRVKEVTLGNGSKITWQYTDRYQTSKVKTATSGGTTRAEYTYTFDSRRRCTQQVRNHLSETIDYTYDAANRLTDEDSSGGSGGPISVSARNLTWTYDDAGNRNSDNDGSSTTNYTYNSENRLTTVAKANGDQFDYTYDANGNQSTRDFTPNGAGSPTVSETFGFDYANRQSSYVKTVSGSGTVANYAYAYVPTGQRLAKNNVGASTTEWFMSDGHNVVTDYSQAGSGSLTLQVSYVNSPWIDAKIARITASGGAKHYYVPDKLESATHLLNTSEAIVNSEATDAWGNVVASSYTVTDRYGFTQREKDGESGVMHYRARSFDSQIGRFLQVDPLRRNVVLQHYIYSINRPSDFTDPFGLQAGPPSDQEVESKAEKAERMRKENEQLKKDLDKDKKEPKEKDPCSDPDDIKKATEGGSGGGDGTKDEAELPLISGSIGPCQFDLSLLLSAEDQVPTLTLNLEVHIPIIDIGPFDFGACGELGYEDGLFSDDDEFKGWGGLEGGISF
jgi:RHS repeat-associated protein